jgi:hypothetical protein
VEEIGQLAGVDAQLALVAGGEKDTAARIEALVQLGNKDEGVHGQNLLVSLRDGTEDLHAVLHQEGRTLLVVHAVALPQFKLAICDFLNFFSRLKLTKKMKLLPDPTPSAVVCRSKRAGYDDDALRRPQSSFGVGLGLIARLRCIAFERERERRRQVAR